MSAPFEALRQIPADQVAERAGLALHRRGGRLWACCPLHGEHTPSMMFDQAGRWHCFGCGQGGDAVALYAALYGLTPGDAARQLAEEYGITGEPSVRPRGPSVAAVRRGLEQAQ